MTHPDELLAEYVDGALDASDRASDRTALEEHVAGCSQCRDEIALARSATQALGRLQNRPAPSGVAAAAVRESTRSADRVTAAARPPRWYRFAPAAAAAAVILLLAIVIPRLTSGDTSAEQATAPLAQNIPSQSIGAGFASPSTAPNKDSVTPSTGNFSGPAKGLEALNQDFDSTSLRTLATPPASLGGYVAESAFKTAKKCVGSAEHGQAGLLVRLIQARYQGTNSYFAVYTPETKGTPTGQVTVIVVTTDGCSLLAFTGAGAGAP